MSNKEVKHRNSGVTTTFSVVEKRVPCPHKFQLYVDYGTTSAGAWLKVCVNATEFGVGYLPKSNPSGATLKVAPPTAV